ncbi:hypothetical protein H072_6966 [Dactylellina haptotyla CBS 200.50]|uniref:GPI inositol-deacylase n=1 Tax=Dactylellina haptotyla (strain CBS 200.50) TaxID=1284197 RepID=S8BIR4_DACHA|nr:hypothetical protein H072_6966 [Dactylellina haptotyla CBS 200.50]
MKEAFGYMLQNLVIDTEIQNDNQSAQMDPSVRVVLLAHSMGGIVAADTLLAIVDDKVIKPPAASPTDSGSRRTPPGGGSLDPRRNQDSYFGSVYDNDALRDETILFPAIIGICAFDTPYLGLSASMFANSAENNFRAASDAFTTASTIAKSLGFFQTQGAASTASVATSSSGAQAAALPAAGQAAGGGWGWKSLALAAAAATTASAAAGAAVYTNRSNITQGYTWVTSHLEFVGILFKPEELKARIVRASSVPGVGIANFYTLLGKGAKSAATPDGKTLDVGGGGIRTFCSLPPKPKVSSPSVSSPTGYAPGPSTPTAVTTTSDNRAAADIDMGSRDLRTWWYTQLNDKAADEVSAHMYMFTSTTNPGYKDMLDGVRKQVMKWSINWYDSRV